MKLKARDISKFEFTNCLFIPNVSVHLIAGVLLLRKGVQIIINPLDLKFFPLVFKNKTLFNGVFLDNNLMLVNIVPVSEPSSHESDLPTAQAGEVDSNLLHWGLGHVSD